MVEKYNKIILKGVPASTGIAEGQAVVILDAKEQDKMMDESILVIHFSTPLFIPSIIRSSAIITDEGGVMSHSAIVAREFSIPCVTGTKEATKIIKDNMEVIVDGAKGYIYRK